MLVRETKKNVEYLTVEKLLVAVEQHFQHQYALGDSARLSILAIYAIYQIFLDEVTRYKGKQLAPLESYISPGSRSHALGDIEIFDENGICFEAVEIKHRKPITIRMINSAYRKIKDKQLSRYYLLTTSERNVDDLTEINEKIDCIWRNNHCQIIVNGVLPSLKYYLRLVSEPADFIDLYTRLLESEFNRASGIKSDHLKIWTEIRQNL